MQRVHADFVTLILAVRHYRFAHRTDCPFGSRISEEWRKAEVVTPENHAFRIKALAPKILEFATGAYEPPSADEYLDSLKMTLLCYESSLQKKQIVLRDYAN